MGQARGAEVERHLGRLAPVVAQHEPGEKGAPWQGQGRGPAQERAAQAVGQPAGGVAGRPVAHPGHGQAGRDVARRGPRPVGLGHGLELAGDPHPFAGEALPEPSGVPAARPRLGSSPSHPDLDPERPRDVLRVADEGEDGVDGAGDGRVEPGQRGGRQGGGGQGDTHNQQHRAAGDQRHHDQHHRRPAGEGLGGQGTGGRGQGHDHGEGVAHTFTSERTASSLAGPMPGTSSNSVTDRKRPWRVR